MRKLLVATRNAGKLIEIREGLRDLPFTIVSLEEFPSVETIAESGDTFVENAALKASGYAQQTNLLTLADDSGLAVDALVGAPGIQSARYAGPAASDADRVNKLLFEMAALEVERRAAHFICAIAVANEKSELIDISVGECAGRIGFEPRGENGFGYDPIFIPSGFHQTFAELPPKAKNGISHRAQALARAVEFLQSLTETSARR